MRIVTNINPLLTDPDQVADVARYFLRGVILANRLMIRAGLIPALYKSGVRYRPEPWGRGVEEFADARTVLRRGWGDCDDLSPWRTAELQEAGDEKADSKISWKTRCSNCGAKVNQNIPACAACGSTRRRRLFHVATRHGDGRVEDPSQYLGM